VYTDARVLCSSLAAVRSGLRAVLGRRGRQALKVHPDKNGDDPRAKERFQDLNDAYGAHKTARANRTVPGYAGTSFELSCRHSHARRRVETGRVRQVIGPKSYGPKLYVYDLEF
jgi:uncharacterized protein (DUF2141 family)